MEKTNIFLKNYQDFQSGISSLNGRAWLKPYQEAAMTRFSRLGLPTIADENWKRTDVSSLAKTSFRLPRGNSVQFSKENFEKIRFPVETAIRLVFVNGRYVEDLSSLGNKSEPGLKVMNLAHAIKTEREIFEPVVKRFSEDSEDAFSMLNTSFMSDGVFLRVPKGAVIRDPVYILYLTDINGIPLMTHPRTVIIAEEASQVSVVEDYLSLGDGVGLTNSETDIVGKQGSHIDHYWIERENLSAFHISNRRIQQERDSVFSSHSILLGGALVRQNIHPVLEGEGGSCMINGIFVPMERQHMDTHIKVEHKQPHGTSRQFYIGILDDRARGIFHGRIKVHAGAQKTDASQTSKNLLLSQSAQVDATPQLEIFANDVKCTHGTTIGQLDEESLFYFRSRGISEESARSLLLVAFAGEVIQRMKLEKVRQFAREIIEKRLMHKKTEEVHG